MTMGNSMTTGKIMDSTMKRVARMQAASVGLTGLVALAMVTTPAALRAEYPPTAPAMPTPGPKGLAPATAPGGKARGDTKSLAPLLQQGQDAFAAGEFKVARDSFMDVISIDHNNQTALYGCALANLHQGDFAHAKDPMEKLMLLNPAPDRTMVINMAALQIAIKNPMRAVKFTKDYLTAHVALLDEQVANAMAIALNQADEPARKMETWKQAVAFYVIYNQKLEAAKPGWKRWGMEWLPAKDVDAKLALIEENKLKLESLGPTVDRLEADMNKARTEYDNVMAAAARAHATPEAVNFYRMRAERAAADYDQGNRAYDAANNKAPAQTFPKEVLLVAMDDTKAPPVGITAVAVAPEAPAMPANEHGIKAHRTRVHSSTNAEDPAIPAPENPPKIKVRKNGSTNNPGEDSKPVEPVTPPITPPVGPPPPVVAIAPTPPVMKAVHIASYAVAFPIATDMAITSASVLDGAKEIVLIGADGATLNVEVVRKDDTGLALVRVAGGHFRPIALADSFAGGAVSCCSYPTVNIFNPTAENIGGTAPAPSDNWKLRLNVNPRLSGAPLMVNGQIVGVELASRDCDPAAVPAVGLDKVRKFVGSDADRTAGPCGDPTGAVYQIMATREVMRAAQSH